MNQGGWQNPGGWQQQQGYGHAPQQAYPPQPNVAAPPTVARVPLFPGERVLYYLRPDQTSTRIQYFLYGILFLVLIFGLYFLYLGIFFDKAESLVWVITNQRIFTVNGEGKVLEQIGNHEITTIVNRNQNALIVHGASKLIMFRRAEKHDIQTVGTILENLRNPAFLQQAPTARFDP
jgi:hypothetical protein